MKTVHFAATHASNPSLRQSSTVKKDGTGVGQAGAGPGMVGRYALSAMLAAVTGIAHAADARSGANDLEGLWKVEGNDATRLAINRTKSGTVIGTWTTMTDTGNWISYVAKGPAGLEFLDLTLYRVTTAKVGNEGRETLQRDDRSGGKSKGDGTGKSKGDGTGKSKGEGTGKGGRKFDRTLSAELLPVGSIKLLVESCSARGFVKYHSPDVVGRGSGSGVAISEDVLTPQHSVKTGPEASPMFTKLVRADRSCGN